MPDRFIPWTHNRAKGNQDTSRHSLCSLVIAAVPQVQVAHGCQDLLQRYQAAPTDLVITDLKMPGMDGLELLQALQLVAPTPVLIAISGDQAALTQARRLTQHTFVKPLPLEQVLAAVRNLDLRHRSYDETA